ncbi:hypothetical protein KP509_1Z111600 [Ceratopteris richardii]|nr:hypothetical protein KP509_1Z111600 [Ceratopteris richardii]
MTFIPTSALNRHTEDVNGVWHDTIKREDVPSTYQFLITLSILKKHQGHT